MISTAEEFKRLRESEIQEEYTRAAHDEATLEVWLDVLEKFNEMSFWVAQNKTVPIEILERLADHPEEKVREMVARKRKIPESLMFKLVDDESPSVRYALACNGKATEAVMNRLKNDPEEFVRNNAISRTKT